MKYLAALLISACFAMSAHADTIRTYTLSTTVQEDGLYEAGWLQIDVTTGMALYGDIELRTTHPSLQWGIHVSEVKGDFITGQSADSTITNTYFFIENLDASVLFQTPTSLINYPGGPLCYLATNCNGGGQGSIFLYTTYTADGNYLSENAMSGTLNLYTTPEPSTLLLFGSGGLGLFGAARRKYLSR